MKQVFISNGIAIQATAGAYDALARTVGGSATVEDFGIWSVTAGAYMDGSTAALSLLNSDLWSANAAAFQLVSAQTSGNPFASPIIQSKDVTRVRYEQAVTPAKQKMTIDDASPFGAIVIGDPIALKLTVRCPGDIAFYEAQINPSAGVVGTAINAAFDSPQRVFSTEIISTSTSATTELAALKVAIVANKTLNSLVTATIDGSGKLVLEAKLYGMIFDAAVTIDGTSSKATVTNTTAPAIGCGSFYEAISEEKKAQYSQGFFNRMYMPTGGETYAASNPGAGAANELITYDRFTIEYNSSTNDMPGFNGAGVGNQAVIYWPAVGTTSNGSAIEAVFNEFTVETNFDLTF
mgnify:CR=1 FL=1